MSHRVAYLMVVHGFHGSFGHFGLSEGSRKEREGFLRCYIRNSAGKSESFSSRVPSVVTRCQGFLGFATSLSRDALRSVDVMAQPSAYLLCPMTCRRNWLFPSPVAAR